jgi:hypothetical protein
MMGLLDGLLENKGIQQALFKRLGNFMVSEGYEMLALSVDPATGEITVNMYKTGECQILLTEKSAENADNKDCQ